MASLFSDFLTALHVRHTEHYSDMRFAQMPFPSMFGLSDLLKKYGVDAAGIKVACNAKAAAFPQLPLPFLADTSEGFLIITAIKDNQVTYLSQQKEFTAPLQEICDAWNGIALLAEASKNSIEPEYEMHHIAQMAVGVKRWGLRILIVALLAFAMWKTELYAQWSAWVLLVFDCVGLTLSWMLVQKALGIHNKAADAVCSVLEEGGCDALSRSEASSFMGIFKWSEVGLAYFSISLLAMLLFPQTLPSLAAVNVLCLPYTLWSIWYQKFKAKTWCTLCVSVQCTLWVLFVCYLLGGWISRIFPLRWDFWVLVCAYAATLLAINAFDNALARHITTDE